MVRIAGFLGVACVASVAILLWLNMPDRFTSGQTDFAADRYAPAVKAVAFDGKRAMGYLKDICDIGPRISGSNGMKKQQDLLQKHFEKHGGKVEFQRFKAQQHSQRKPVEMTNMIIRWHPEKQRRIIICCHYDTRPIADQEDERRNWTKPFVSANDGASGSAWMMELAHHMKDLKTQVGVDFVIFDGEEYIFESGRDKYFFGSEHFASAYKRDRQKRYQYIGAILLDMIAGKNARFPYEKGSMFMAGALVQEIWQIANQQRCRRFRNQPSKTEVLDDHIALNRAGIPAIDIIDFDYEHWHKLSDVPENCAPEPMEEVARVLTIWLQRVR